MAWDGQDNFSLYYLFLMFLNSQKASAHDHAYIGKIVLVVLSVT